MNFNSVLQNKPQQNGVHRSKFIILASSYKEGGKCVGTIKLNDENGKPACQLARLVTQNDGAIPDCWLQFKNNSKQCVSIEILDTVECWVKSTPTNIQPENYLVLLPDGLQQPWLSHQKFNPYSIDQLNEINKYITGALSNSNYIFHDNHPTILPETLMEYKNKEQQSHSLELRLINHIWLKHCTYNNKIKTRASFWCGNVYYENIRVTDPLYSDPNITNLDKCLTLFSIANKPFEYDQKYYKLLASIIPIRDYTS